MRRIVLTVSLLSSLVSVAQDIKQLDSVVVTAQKTEQFLKDVPLSVSSISSRDVEQFRIWNTKQLTGIVPNLFSSNPGDNRNITSIRGISTTSYDPAIATYIDGVNQFGLDTYIAELADIERIEVLRGPQGTLYGRNAMGGVINIITRKPSNSLNGYAELSLGNYQMSRFTAALRTPLITDKLFVGISGSYQSRNGYFTNEFNNETFDKQYNYNGNYFIKWLPTHKWTIDLNFKHLSNRNDGAFTLIQGLDAALADPYKINQDATATMIDNTINSSIAVNYKGEAFNFSSQTSYQSNYRIYDDPLDGDFSPIDGVTIINDYGKDFNKVNVFTQEFKFSSPAKNASSISWVAGAYAFLLDNPVKQAVHFGEDAEMVGSPQKNFSLINTNEGRGSGIAVFGQATYKILKSLEATAGLRFDHESKENSVLGEYADDASGDQMVIFPGASAKASFNAFSPKLGLLYRIHENANIYLNYSRGFRAGGLSQLGSDPSQPPLIEYDPEYSSSFEIGAKENYFDRKLFINVAAFFTKVNDAQVPTLILPDASTVTRNAGRLESMGMDMEISALPFNGLTVDYSLGYTHSEFKELKLSQYGQEVDLKGNRQLFSPDITSMLALQFEHPINMVGKTGNTLRLFIRGEWFYMGTQYFDLSNTMRQSPYHLLNSRFGFRNQRVELGFWMRNITDTRYVDYAYDFGAVHLADPQTLGGSLKFKL